MVVVRRIAHPAHLVLVVLLSAGLVAGAPSSASAAGPGVCAGIERCRVVARVDVDGNGTRDPVAVTRLGEDGGAHGTVVVRVRVAAHRIVKARRVLAYWYGPVWQGAGFLDGRKGRELVVGHTAGAHSEFFRALTWRHGRLVDLRAPGGHLDWYVDGACTIAVGYLHPSGTPAGTLLHRSAERTCGDPTYSGTAERYEWRAGKYKLVRRTTYPTLSEDVANRWVGFRVPGLARY